MLASVSLTHGPTVGPPIWPSCISNSFSMLCMSAGHFFHVSKNHFKTGLASKERHYSTLNVQFRHSSDMATLLQLSRFAVQTSVYVSQPAKINRKCDVTLISRARLPQTFFSQLSMVVNLLGAVLHPVARELLNSTWNHSQFNFKPWMQSRVVPTV